MEVRQCPLRIDATLSLARPRGRKPPKKNRRSLYDEMAKRNSYSVVACCCGTVRIGYKLGKCSSSGWRKGERNPDTADLPRSRKRPRTTAAIHKRNSVKADAVQGNCGAEWNRQLAID